MLGTSHLFLSLTHYPGGPVAMLRGAAIYGGFTYALTGGIFKQRQFEYKEEVVDF